ncbi:MAG: PKD domain-containing protein [Bacteroidota bacterium]
MRGRNWILVGLLLLVVSPSWSRHIIGGVMTYECLGNDQYEFTLRVYRDCNCTNCAVLDDQAEIGIYKCSSPDDCDGQWQNSPYDRVSVSLNSVNQVDEPDYPCLIPPNVCGEEGIYRFTLTLPQSTDSYFVSYQRCCRNVTIANILNPEDSGATFMIELTPLAQQLCNSSPSFETYPPMIICNDAPLVYDHSAVDLDGDQLVYEFCAPLLGGGPQLDPAFYNTCTGANPIPACPPPYNTVTFRAPNYTPTQPMAGDPMISINPQTGLITGTPEFQGQFVVGVCVSEYRNGLLLSRVFRDFQFNVASCDPTVVADIEEDVQISDQEFVINSCGEYTVTFNNQSYQQSFIDNFGWTFDVGGGHMESFSEWHPTVTFPGVGTYEGQLILNENTDCGDTARIFVNIFPSIDANFSFAYDTCVAGPVAFTDLSTTGSCCLTDWSWQFGDGSSSITQNPEHIYQQPGDIPVTLTVQDINSCENSLTQIVPYYPVPSLIVIAPSEETSCQPAEIFFDNLSFPIDTTYDIFWDLGDGGSSTEISPTYIYENPGVYTVSVDITSPIGCQIDTVFNDLITVLPSPVAGFSYSPDQPSNLFPEVQFTDESSGAVHWRWDFGVPPSSNTPSPTFVFPDTGLYLVSQIVTHPSGCTDTLTALIDVIPEIRYYLPNAFSPNGDGANDTFKGKGFLKGISEFQFRIWNRWGEPVFTTTDPDIAWNGQKNNVGALAPNGVYLVVVKFKDPRGQPIEMKGYATLIR